MKKKVLALARHLLDDEYGINEEAMEHLHNLLKEVGAEEIVHCVDATDGRFYISEEAAKTIEWE